MNHIVVRVRVRARVRVGRVGYEPARRATDRDPIRRSSSLVRLRSPTVTVAPPRIPTRSVIVVVDGRRRPEAAILTVFSSATFTTRGSRGPRSSRGFLSPPLPPRAAWRSALPSPQLLSVSRSRASPAARPPRRCPLAPSAPSAPSAASFSRLSRCGKPLSSSSRESFASAVSASPTVVLSFSFSSPSSIVARRAFISAMSSLIAFSSGCSLRRTPVPRYSARSSLTKSRPASLSAASRGRAPPKMPPPPPDAARASASAERALRLRRGRPPRSRSSRSSRSSREGRSVFPQRSPAASARAPGRGPRRSSRSSRGGGPVRLRRLFQSRSGEGERERSRPPRGGGPGRLRSAPQSRSGRGSGRSRGNRRRGGRDRREGGGRGGCARPNRARGGGARTAVVETIAAATVVVAVVAAVVAAATVVVAVAAAGRRVALGTTPVVVGVCAGGTLGLAILAVARVAVVVAITAEAAAAIVAIEAAAAVVAIEAAAAVVATIVPAFSTP